MSTGSRGSSKICSQQPAYMHPPVQLNPAHCTENSKLQTLHPNPRPQKPQQHQGTEFRDRRNDDRFHRNHNPYVVVSPSSSSPPTTSPGPVTFHRVTRLSPCTGGQIQNYKRQTRSEMCEPGEKMHADRRALPRLLGRSISAGVEGRRARAGLGARARVA